MRTLVTGNGLLASALRKHAPHFIYPQIGDLTNYKKADILLDAYHPNMIIHTAALVGGVKLNAEQPEELFYQNIAMSANIIHAAVKHGIKKVIAFGSTCSFDERLDKLDDVNIHSGEPYINNYAYGYAKRMTQIHLSAANNQYGLDYTYFIPASMFGPNDQFSLANGHVIPSLIHKCYLAKLNKEPLRVWGDGSATREVLFSEDMAKIIIETIDHDMGAVLVASGEEVSVRVMAETIASAMDFQGDIVWEADKPSGQKCRPKVDTSRLNSFINFKFTKFVDAIKCTVEWFNSNYPNIRGAHE